MDNQRAIELVRNGGTILCLHVPIHTEIGIDLRVFDTGSLFKGIKMIPPGIHILYSSPSSFVSSSSSSSSSSNLPQTTNVSSVPTDKGNSVRTSIFLDIEPGGVYVFVWNEQEERLHYVYNNRTVQSIPSTSTAAPRNPKFSFPQDYEIEGYVRSVRNFELDKHLGPYPLEQYGLWRRLSTYLFSDMVYRIEPIDKFIYADTDLSMVKKILRSIDEKQYTESNNSFVSLTSSSSTELSSVSSASSSSPSRLYYTLLAGCGKHTNPSSSITSPENSVSSLPYFRTRYAIDTSITLIIYIIDLLSIHNPIIIETTVLNHILGELQTSFLLFYLGQSFCSLEQWKYLTDTLCRCEDILLGNYDNIQSLLFSNDRDNIPNNDTTGSIPTVSLSPSTMMDTDTLSSSSDSAYVTLSLPFTATSNRSPLSSKLSARYKKHWDTAVRILNRNFFTQAYTVMRNQMILLFPSGSDAPSAAISNDSSSSSHHQNLLSLGFDLQHDTFFVTSLRALGTTLAQYERDILPSLASSSSSSVSSLSLPHPPLQYTEVRQSIHQYLQVCKDNFGWEPVIHLPPLPTVNQVNNDNVMDESTTLTASSLSSSVNPTKTVTTSSASSFISSPTIPYTQSTGYNNMNDLLKALLAEGGDDDLPVIVNEEHDAALYE